VQVPKGLGLIRFPDTTNVTTIATRLSTAELQANRYQLLSRLADDLAHEIKNPLHAMVINLELVKKRIDTGAKEQALQRIALVEQELRRVNDLVDATMQLLRQPRDPENPPPIELDAALETIKPILELKARLNHVELTLNRGGQGAPLGIRTDVLHHIVLGLFSNAVAAMPEGGRLELTTSHTPHEVVLAIADTGAGLPRAAFEEATNAGATNGAPLRQGGLAAATSLIQETGGRLELDESSGSERGTTVRVIFPRRGSA
jgi:signal transduction histidine kinase